MDDIIIAFDNEIYNVIRQAIIATSNKLYYGKYDVAKLVLALYKKDYDYLIDDNEYRTQVKMLDGYFGAKYGYSLISLDIVKLIAKLYEKSPNIINEINDIEKLVRKEKNIDQQNIDIAQLLINKDFAGLIYVIENNESYKYACAVIYDRYLNV